VLIVIDASGNRIIEHSMINVVMVKD